MRKRIIIGLVLGVIVSAIGCAQPKDYEMKLFSADSVSQDIYDDVQKSWDKWNEMSEESQHLSSSNPGYCGKGFDNWNECEEFLGFSVPNAMEACSWVEKATYVGMPEGYMDTSHISATYYGTEEGEIEWIEVRTGYRHEKVKIIVAALLYGEEAEKNDSDSVSSIELQRTEYLEKAEESMIQVTLNTTENAFDKDVYGVKDGVLYRITVTGELKLQEQVEETFIKVMDYFFGENWQQYSDET